MPKSDKPTSKKPRKKVTKKAVAKTTHKLPAGPLIATMPPAVSSAPPVDSNPATVLPQSTTSNVEARESVVSAVSPEKAADTPTVPHELPQQGTASPAPQAVPVSTPADMPSTTDVSSVSTEAARSRRRLLKPLLLLAVIAALLFGAMQYQTSRQASADDRLIAEISKRVVLPTSEKPRVTTVIDETKVNQPFLANSRKGDKVLLYFQESRAVVYRPSTGQVVNMGPLVSPNPRVQLRNGTNVSIPLPFRNKLTGSTEYVIASQDTAVKRDYSQTIVIDVTGNRPDVARRLAVLLDAKVAELPGNETRPDADMLVIVGSDAK